MNMGNYKNLLTKISYLCIHVCIKQDIFRLQISMDHHMPVTVIHTRKDLLKQAPTFFLIQLRKVERHFKDMFFRRNSSTYNSPTYKTVKMHETSSWDTFEMGTRWIYTAQNAKRTLESKSVTWLSITILPTTL